MIAPLPTSPVADIELQLLLDAVYRYCGYDFRDYSQPTIKRRVAERVRAEGVRTISGLQEKVLHDMEALERLVYGLSVNTTSLFRDPSFFAQARTAIVPMLRTFPLVRIWVAGCSTGEEAYALAILLHEENLLARCKIYATDVSDTAIEHARSGTLALDSIRDAEQRYHEAGGKRRLQEYVNENGVGALVDPALRESIIFSTYNLASDGSFNEFQLIVCRGVLNHFNKSLAYRAHQLLLESLVRFGYLALGSSESLRYTPHERCYDVVPGTERIYRRIR